MVSFAVLASGNGTNFQALIDGVKSGELKGVALKVLISDNPEAYAIVRAKNSGIPVHIVKKTDFPKREDMDIAIMNIADSYNVDYVYLLGYMRLVKAPEIFAKYRNRMFNLHPAILPSFTGMDAQKQAFDYGCKVSGVTIHIVDEGLDHGPIVYQQATSIAECKSGEDVHNVLRPLEHAAVKKVAQMVADGKFVIEGRRAAYILNK